MASKDILSTNFTFAIGGKPDVPVSVEIDTRAAEDGGDNDRRLNRVDNFMPGDKVAFLVFFDQDKYEIDYITSSIQYIPGSNVVVGTAKFNNVDVKQEEQIIFPERGASATLGKQVAPSNRLTFDRWNIGNSPSAHYMDGDLFLDEYDHITLRLPEINFADKIADADTPEIIKDKLKRTRVPTIYRLEYYSQARMCWIQTPNKATVENDAKAHFQPDPPWDIHVIIYFKDK